MSDKSRSTVNRLAKFATDLTGHVILLPMYLIGFVRIVVTSVSAGAVGALVVLAIGLAHKEAMDLSVTHPIVVPLAGVWGAAMAFFFIAAQLFQALSGRED